MSATAPGPISPLGEPRMAARRKRLAHLAFMVFTLMRERFQGGTITEFDGVESADLIDALRACSSYTNQIDCLDFDDHFVIQIQGIDSNNYIIKFTLFDPEFSLLAARVAIRKLSLIAGLEHSSHHTMDILDDYAVRLKLGGVTADRAFLIGISHIIGFIDHGGEGEDDRLTRIAAAITPRREELRRLRSKLPPPSINYDDEGDQAY